MSDRTDPAASARTGRWVTDATGRWLHLRDAAPAVTELAPPLVLIHGAGSSAAVWRSVWSDVNQGRRLLAVDLPGHGSSDGSAEAPLVAQADAVDVVVTDAGLGRADMLTHGLGNLVGAELLARGLAGELGWTVRRRVLLNGPVPPDPAPAEADAAPDGGHERAQELSEHGSRWAGALIDHPAPLTVVWGDADRAGTEPAERLLAARTEADYVRLPGVGDEPMCETPSSLARVVLDVLS